MLEASLGSQIEAIGGGRPAVKAASDIYSPPVGYISLSLAQKGFARLFNVHAEKR